MSAGSRAPFLRRRRVNTHGAVNGASASGTTNALAGSQAIPDDPSSAAPIERSDIARLLLLRRKHWQRTRLITGVLLALWFSTCFLTVFYARELARFSVFGWPLSFYLAAQGASLVYLAIIGSYALLMRRLDRRIRAQIEGEAP